MMLVNVLVPLFLAIDANVSNTLDFFHLEYSYNVSKLIIKYKEPMEVMELTSTIICWPLSLRSIRCFIHDITYETTVKYIFSGITNVKKNLLIVKTWFYIWFNINDNFLTTYIRTEDEEIKSFINHFCQQFNLGINLEDHKLHMGVRSEFTVKEKTPIGVCQTMYDINVSYIEKNVSKETNSIFQIRLLSMLNYSDQQDLHVHIAKYRTRCDTLNKTIKMANYLHEMKVQFNKFSVLTKMDVHLSPEQNYLSPSESSLLFSETTRLNLIDINNGNKLYNDTYDFN